MLDVGSVKGFGALRLSGGEWAGGGKMGEGIVSKCSQQTQTSPGPNSGGLRGSKRNTSSHQWLKHLFLFVPLHPPSAAGSGAVSGAALAWPPLALVIQRLRGRNRGKMVIYFIISQTLLPVVFVVVTGS